MQIHSKEIIRSLEWAINTHKNPKEGDLVISHYGIMETCAPYIGRMCAEFLDGEWLWQPYSRDTEYLADLKEAEIVLDYWDEDYMVKREMEL